jgi:lipoyl(octanoyl) transferase
MLIKHLGLVDYAKTYQAMQDFTSSRDSSTRDELWICEHPRVYTLGLSAQLPDFSKKLDLDLDHDLDNDLDIPWVKTNRGGQITYHGPGQLIAYPLLDLSRRGYFVKEYVHRLEEALIKCLNAWGVSGYRVPGAPGVYVNPQDPQSHATWSTLKARVEQGPNAGDPFAGLAKIAALGVKVSKHCTYHGLALNVDMDLSPFKAINPCGYPGLQVIDLRQLGVVLNSSQVAQVLAEKLSLHLAP